MYRARILARPTVPWRTLREMEQILPTRSITEVLVVGTNEAELEAPVVGLTTAEPSSSRSSSSDEQPFVAGPPDPVITPVLTSDEAVADIKFCCICSTEDVTFTCVPCGHKCFCVNCRTLATVYRLSKCPLCRARVFSIMILS